jgi:hypothetical protein
MKIRLKTLRYAVAAAVCGVLATGPSFAQDKSPSTEAPPPAKAGSDAPRGDAAGAGAGGTGAIKSGSDAKAGDAGTSGDRAAVQNPPPGPQTIELSKDAGRKGTTTPSATSTSGPQGVVLSHGINLVTPDNGYAGLLRRANRKALIANNAAKRPVNPLAGTANLPLTHPGREGPMARNAVGLVLPGSGAAGTGPHVPVLPPHAGPSGTGPIGTAVVGGAHLPPTPPGAPAAPALHTAGINGTTMGHIASGPGIIGGPAKDRSGINGTTMRPKH